MLQLCSICKEPITPGKAAFVQSCVGIETANPTSTYGVICSAPCARAWGESGLTLAALWPQDATEEELIELRQHEDELLRRPMNPRMFGLLAGRIFRAREEREWQRKSPHP